MVSDMTEQTNIKKKRGISSYRVLAEVVIIGVFVVGLFLQTGTGSLSAIGVWEIFALCPIGALTSFIASKTLIPPQVIGLLLFVVFILLLGKAFCAWVCPVQLWYKIFNRSDVGDRKARKANRLKGGAATEGAVEGVVEGAVEGAGASSGVAGASAAVVEAGAEAVALAENPAAEKAVTKRRIFGAPHPNLRGGLQDSRNWVLFGALAATFVVGVPVFCLICPIGLTFASLVSLWNFLNFNTFGPGVIIFPLILLVEILVLRRWCHTLCPVAAVISWIARGNKTFVPVHNSGSCLAEKDGLACDKCVAVCPEEINVKHKELGAPLHQCTKCHLCAEACPGAAISFPFLPSKKKRQESKEVLPR